MDDDKEDFVERMLEVAGRLPENTHYILKLLAHPELIQHTQIYFGGIDNRNRCLKYEPPWSCSRESEARYENIKYGWSGAGTEQDFWCANCRVPGRVEDEDEVIQERLRDAALNAEELARNHQDALNILDGIREEEKYGPN